MHISRKMTPLLGVGTMLVSGCGAAPTQDRPATAVVAARQVFSQAPSLGVACSTASSIACDRIGVAVWLKRPATHVNASIDGRPVVLRPPRARGGWWEGYLHPAGLIDGPLRVTPDRGRYVWTGRHPRDAHVAVTIVRGLGIRERAAATVPLRAGWG
jgi:hypothetical protein